VFRVKVCGLTRAQDVRAAVRAGADAVGFQMSRGPRKVTPATARKLARLVPPGVLKVGVFVDEPVARMRRIARHCGFDAVQLHGDETAATAAAVGLPVLKAVRMKNVKTPGRFGGYPVAALLLDRYNPLLRGGTGESFDWKWARAADRLRLPILLAGGLHPGNVARAVRIARPFGVDTASGVESRPGLKDPRLVSLFVKRALSALKRK
jgi:phosphoribosylanthranilate isomerase